ncbi:mitochondrial distribution and morphology protein 10 [Aspergillus awamori]|uniref:Mitochondrial distribution and morphology protein 10 n=1 Tax=Aspergillus awamori TaxID=105351 RepID=A0A401KII7_ASPAW|nr:mitochondrial distribution and morphology protein 10 [Aspergillus awamori]GKZ52741.1 mitochondrial distribution and morphology protein 10 [Aspergillus niger]
MLDFMDYIQLAFAEATNWNRDNSYSSLTATAQSLLDFSTPERLRVHLSSLSTPHFATSYTLGTVGLIDGSVSYLFSTVPLDKFPSRSALIPLRKLSPGYRQVQAPIAPIAETILINDDLNDASAYTTIGKKATLFHATLHLPPPTTLNALFLRRISPTMQLSLAVCSTRGPPLSKSAPQASLLAQLSHNTGKYNNEYLFSTDNALFGWRGLWNFGPDPRDPVASGSSPRLSLLSAGAEAYYSPVSSLIGMSTGLRFSTLPAATDVPLSNSSPTASTSNANANTPISTFPYTLTLTLTPLTGSLSTTYSLRASPNLAFSSRFGFNVYSWESEMVAGCELWRKSKPRYRDDGDGVEWARRKIRESLFPHPHPHLSTSTPNDIKDLAGHALEKSGKGEEEENESVLKIRVDQSWNVRLLWEGRVKELLVSAGVGLGPSSFSSSYVSDGGGESGGLRKSYWRGVGISVSYSS